MFLVLSRKSPQCILNHKHVIYFSVDFYVFCSSGKTKPVLLPPPEIEDLVKEEALF